MVFIVLIKLINVLCRYQLVLDRTASLPPALAAVHKELKRVARDFGLVVKGVAVIRQALEYRGTTKS